MTILIGIEEGLGERLGDFLGIKTE